MNLQQAKIILEKINRLYQSMTLDSNIDVHEQELMLSYIRQFYANFSSDGSVIVRSPEKGKGKTTSTTIVPPTVVTPPPIVKSTPVIKREEPKVVLPKNEIEVPVPTPKPVVEPKPTPVVVQEEEIEVPPMSVEIPKPVAPKPKTSTGEIDDLFQHQEAKELSERLSQLPIIDLTKSMGLNEKILTTNELFGKDNAAFNKALLELNSCKTFDEAKDYLAQYAKTFDWTKKSKKKKAQIFIKLVRRRF